MRTASQEYWKPPSSAAQCYSIKIMCWMPCLTQELIASACVRVAGRLHTVKYFAEVPATLEHSLALCVEYDLLSTWQAGIMLDTVILCSKEHSETFYGAANALLHV